MYIKFKGPKYYGEHSFSELAKLVENGAATTKSIAYTLAIGEPEALELCEHMCSESVPTWARWRRVGERSTIAWETYAPTMDASTAVHARIDDLEGRIARLECKLAETSEITEELISRVVAM